MIYRAPVIISMQLTPLEGQVCLHRIIQGRKLQEVATAINRTRETIRAIEAKILTRLRNTTKTASLQRKGEHGLKLQVCYDP